MNYKKGSIFGKSQIILFVVAAVVCFIVARGARTTPRTLVDTVGACLVYPFLQGQRYIVDPLISASSYCQKIVDLEPRYNDLLKERDDLQAELLALQATQTFSQETEDIRDFQKQYSDGSSVLVRILMKHFGSDGHFFLVEGGTRQGFEKDKAVVYKNCLVGRVAEVYPDYSKIILIIDPSCKVAAYCNSTTTCGIYQGDQSSVEQGLLTHVGHLSSLEEGDTVFSSGDGLIFPKGFGIGTIVSFKKHEGDMHYLVAVKPLLDLTIIAYCYILEKGIVLTPCADELVKPPLAEDFFVE